MSAHVRTVTKFRVSEKLNMRLSFIELTMPSPLGP